MIQKLFIAMLLAVFCATATAEFIGPGSSNSLVKVNQIKGMRDDSKVTLVGNLINEVAVEFYTFQDDTGKMVVQIDHDELRGMQVTPDTKIRIRGEVDAADHNSQMDVSFVEIVN